MPPAPRQHLDEIDRIKAEIRASFNEDPANLQWSLDKVDRLAWSIGPGIYSGLVLIMFNVIAGEDEARSIWHDILAHRGSLEKALGRPVTLRVAALDHLAGSNRSSARPRILEVLQAHAPAEHELLDPVTGLHTASFLQDQIPREFGRARRFSLDLSRVHLEIDDFARITETLGRTIGTLLLREAAGIIGGCIRTIDYAARISSAEFALLLTETDRMGAYYVCERIRQKVEEFYLERRVDGRPFEVTVSAGIASFPEDADSADDLTRKACEAYYTARARGKSRVAVYYRERREYMRLSADTDGLQVTLIPEGSGASAAASMKNISSGGVLFESDKPIDLGRTVHILCRNRREADQVLIPGRVVRIERFENEQGARYEIGVLFDLVVEEQLEGVIGFLERFISSGEDPSAASNGSRAT